MPNIYDVSGDNCTPIFRYYVVLLFWKVTNIQNSIFWKQNNFNVPHIFRHCKLAMSTKCSGCNTITNYCTAQTVTAMYLQSVSFINYWGLCLPTTPAMNHSSESFSSKCTKTLTMCCSSVSVALQPVCWPWSPPFPLTFYPKSSLSLAASFQFCCSSKSAVSPQTPPSHLPPVLLPSIHPPVTFQ